MAGMTKGNKTFDEVKTVILNLSISLKFVIQILIFIFPHF